MRVRGCSLSTRPWCDDCADEVEDAVDKSYELLVDPLNETLTYLGADALWSAAMTVETPKPIVFVR